MSYRLDFAEQLLLCLIYYRIYASHAFMGLLFTVSSPTVCHRVRATATLMAGHFRMLERRGKLSKAEKNDLLYLMTDGTEHPIQRPLSRSKRKAEYSGKEKCHTASHQIITDNKKRILAVGLAHPERKYDKRIYDDRVDKPPDVPALGDLGCLGTALEIPLKASKKTPLTKQEKDDNTWHAAHQRRVRHWSDEKVQGIRGYSPQQSTSGFIDFTGSEFAPKQGAIAGS